jgi:class 3 adenylate cyclase
VTPQGNGAARDVAGAGGGLLRKYVALFATVVCAVLLGYGLIDAWFVYRDQVAALERTQGLQAAAAAAEISRFLQGVESQLGWTTQLPRSAGLLQQHRTDALRLLRQTPAVTGLRLLDATGREHLRVSRLDMDVIGSQQDLSADPAFVGAQSGGVYFGPVTFLRDSEPYMTIAVAGSRRSNGVTVAEVNLKLIWEVVSRIRPGESGLAYVVDGNGRLVAHPDISLVLRNTDLSTLPQTRAARVAPAGGAMFAAAATQDPVFTAFAPVAPPGWTVFVQVARDEALAPLYASLARTAVLLLAGLAAAGIAGIVLARRMMVPIRALQAGAERIGSGDLTHRVEVKTGDELQTLAERFNAMSRDLAESLARNERLGRFRRFLTAQLADILESSGGEALLESHRREVAVVFCDIRGFTAFAEAAEPEAVMKVLGEYHAALGALISLHEGTLERFVGDGLMVLFNDPLPCDDPCGRAAAMALDMRAAVAGLAGEWRRRGYALGFGIGMAYGYATLGRIGFEGRFDYSAIGRTPNLAARLCAQAADGQVLTDGRMVAELGNRFVAEPVGELVLKGIRQAVPAWNVAGRAASQ